MDGLLLTLRMKAYRVAQLSNWGRICSLKAVISFIIILWPFKLQLMTLWCRAFYFEKVVSKSKAEKYLRRESHIKDTKTCCL